MFVTLSKRVFLVLSPFLRTIFQFYLLWLNLLFTVTSCLLNLVNSNTSVSLTFTSCSSYIKVRLYGRNICFRTVGVNGTWNIGVKDFLWSKWENTARMRLTRNSTTKFGLTLPSCTAFSPALASLCKTVQCQVHFMEVYINFIMKLVYFQSQLVQQKQILYQNQLSPFLNKATFVNRSPLKLLRFI